MKLGCRDGIQASDRPCGNSGLYWTLTRGLLFEGVRRPRRREERMMVLTTGPHPIPQASLRWQARTEGKKLYLEPFPIRPSRIEHGAVALLKPASCICDR
jgi:hypothetical protein